MARGVNFSVLLHSFALIKIQLHSGGNIVTGFRRESKTAGVSVSEGSHGVFSAAFLCLLGFLNMVRWSFWSLVCNQHVWLSGHPLIVRPALTLPCGSFVCWWCCSPCCWCWGFPKIFTVPTATAVLLGCGELIGVSGRLQVLDFGKVSRLGGTLTADGTNAPTSSRVSTVAAD